MNEGKFHSIKQLLFLLNLKVEEATNYAFQIAQAYQNIYSSRNKTNPLL